MSPRNETPEPWRTAMENAGMYSLSDLWRRTGIATSTVAALVYGRRRSDESTIQGVAKALRLPEPTIREWASLALGEVGPWEPPAEAARLNKRQRAALDELIRAMTADAGFVQMATGSGKSGTVSHLVDVARPTGPDLSKVAARRGRSEGRRARDVQDTDAQGDDPSHE